MILYGRLCHMIYAADSGPLPVGVAYITTDVHADADTILHRFIGSHVAGPWYRETPDLRAYVTAVSVGHFTLGALPDGGDDVAARLIDTETALRYSGRRSARTLYRWSAEGRITRYGGPRRALWDTFELPRGRSESPPAPR